MLFGIVALSLAQSPINGCYSNKDGTLRVVTDASQCTKHESFICELSDHIIQTVIGLHLRKSVENSYMANLKKVCKFIQDGKISQAIIQLDVFIAKVVIDVVQGDISKASGSNLINMAIDLIKLLRS